MVQIIQNTGSRGSRIGGQVGQALSQQLPKEAERYRLSQGLQNLGQSVNPAKPLDAISQLLSLPGMTPEKAQMIFPFLQQQMARNEATQRAGQGMGQPQGQPNAINQEMPQQPQQVQGIGQPQGQPQTLNEVPEQRGIVTPEATQQALEPFRPISPQEELARADQLMQQYPASFPTRESAINEVRRQESGRQAQKEAAQQQYKLQKGIQDEAEKEFNNQVTEKLQTSLADSYGSVWGDLQGDLKAKMFRDIRNGSDVKTAANKYGKEALEMAKTMQKLKTLGAQYYTDADATENQKAFSQIRQKFSDINRLKEYSQILQKTQNIPAAYASSFAFPLNQNRQNKQIIDKIQSPFTTTRQRPFSDSQYEELASNLMKNWGENDSPLTYGLALRNKNLDETKFYDVLRENYRDKLNGRQIDELEDAGRIIPNFSALWLGAFTGEK